jgi:hypothetical protein
MRPNQRSESGAHLFGIQVLLAVPRDMLRESKGGEALPDRFTDDFGERAFGVAAELARVTMVADRHGEDCTLAARLDSAQKQVVSLCCELESSTLSTLPTFSPQRVPIT